MEKLPELIYGSSDKKLSREISKLSKEKKIRKIAPRLYTSNFELAPGIIVRQNIFAVLGNLYPDALLSHRSALEFAISPKDNVYLTFGYTRNVELPGVTVRLLERPGAIEGDGHFFGLRVSQEARAYLENLQPSRASSNEFKTLGQSAIEEKLEMIIRVKGEDAVNVLRDRAKAIAPILGFENEYEKLDGLIGALLSTHPSKVLKSPVAAARAFGMPYDAKG